MAKILVLDHDASSGRALRYLLDGDGHHTTSHALEAAAMHALAREPFEIVIANVDTRTDSGRVLRQLRGASPAPCVFAMTARDARHEIARAHDAGACAVFKKPIDYAELADAILAAHHCAKHGHRRSGLR